MAAVLPGEWEDIGDGYFVKRYAESDTFLEANFLPDGSLLRLQAKVSGEVGGVLAATQCVMDMRVSPNDRDAVQHAVDALDAALSKHRAVIEQSAEASDCAPSLDM